jgi:hypothetical protein
MGVEANAKDPLIVGATVPSAHDDCIGNGIYIAGLPQGMQEISCELTLEESNFLLLNRHNDRMCIMRIGRLWRKHCSAVAVNAILVPTATELFEGCLMMPSAEYRQGKLTIANNGTASMQPPPKIPAERPDGRNPLYFGTGGKSYLLMRGGYWPFRSTQNRSGLSAPKSGGCLFPQVLPRGSPKQTPTAQPRGTIAQSSGAGVVHRLQIPSQHEGASGNSSLSKLPISNGPDRGRSGPALFLSKNYFVWCAGRFSV